MVESSNTLTCSIVLNVILIIWLIINYAKLSDMRGVVNFITRGADLSIVHKYLIYYTSLYYLAKKKSNEYRNAFYYLHANRSAYSTILTEDVKKDFLSKSIFTKDWETIDLPDYTLDTLRKNGKEFEKQQRKILSYL